jgi:hypothetical protein
MHQNIVQHRIKLGMVSLCIERLEKISTTIKRDREFAHAFELWEIYTMGERETI